MTKTKIFLTVAVLLVLVSVFGAWTGGYDTEIRYAQATPISTQASETINYTSIVEEGFTTTAGGCPMYYPISDLTNACGAIAGAEIVAFYDKYYENLVPNWVSYYTSSGKYRIQDGTNVPAIMREMYTLMRTNVDDVGVSRTDCLNGLQSYINNHGYKVNYESVTTTGNKLNYEKCKNAIDNNKVIILFTTPTTVYDIGISTNRHIISSTNITGAHIMVVCGYYKVSYYNNSKLIRTDTYVSAVLGWDGMSMSFYKIDSTTTQAAYIVNIQ
ncbi:MAG: hypothetical protein K2M64_02870 [Clostridia bacterium]|nr:hypothetical protein [Clostridia bacterium]